MSNLEKEYDIGREAALDAFESIAEQVGEGSPAASLAGFLTYALFAVHSMAPNEATAEELIQDCMDFVKSKKVEETIQ